MEGLYQFLADAVLVLHSVIVAFIIIGLVLIVLGGLLRWRWITNPWFRATHLIGIAIVVAQAWLGRLCPLTILEAWLRQQAGGGQLSRQFRAILATTPVVLRLSSMDIYPSLFVVCDLGGGCLVQIPA